MSVAIDETLLKPSSEVKKRLAQSQMVQNQSSEEDEPPNVAPFRLLSLPAELRGAIFEHVLAPVRCRRPLIIWDDVCTGIAGRKDAVSTAILRVCRQTYEDCISILYEGTTVEISLRSDVQDSSFPRFQTSWGSIENCVLLPRLRHIQLEVNYTSHNNAAVLRTAERIRQLSKVLKETGKLKSIDINFCQNGMWIYLWASRDIGAADPIVYASKELLFCERILGVTRNMAAKKYMGLVAWHALRKEVDGNGSLAEDEEVYREFNFDTFETIFAQKN